MSLWSVELGKWRCAYLTLLLEAVIVMVPSVIVKVPGGHSGGERNSGSGGGSSEVCVLRARS